MPRDHFSKILFVDFFDSFSFNIVQHIEEFGHVEVVIQKWNELNDQTILSEEFAGVILGPGPGHPNEYKPILEKIKKLLELQRPLLGICLGHQLIWSALGEPVKVLKVASHGVPLMINLPSWLSEDKEKVEIQRYNSLGIEDSVHFRSSLQTHHGESWCFQGVVWATKFEEVLTYQFHPESVGTTCPTLFFKHWAPLSL